MRRVRTLGITAAALGALSACSSDRLHVPEYNNPTPEGVASDPVVALNLAAGGIITRDRADIAVVANGIFGREVLNYTPTDSRNVTGYLVNPDDPTSFGSGNFLGRFQTLKNLQNFYTIIEAATTLTELTQRFSIASLDVALASVEVATEVGSRFALLAGGILSGIADALTDPRSDKQPR